MKTIALLSCEHRVLLTRSKLSECEKHYFVSYLDRAHYSE